LAANRIEKRDTPSCSLSRPALELEVGTTKFLISGTALFLFVNLLAGWPAAVQAIKGAI
jgi:hypothetical protein